jgi:hypothetical protein
MILSVSLSVSFLFSIFTYVILIELFGKLSMEESLQLIQNLLLLVFL